MKKEEQKASERDNKTKHRAYREKERETDEEEVEIYMKCKMGNSSLEK